MTDHGSILVVDDDETNRMVVRVLLERRGYQVLEASSGSEALELFAAHSFKLILMDLAMPGMDGLETTQYIRRHDKGAYVSVAALTANTTLSDQEKCHDAGMNAVLSKPFDPQQFDRLMFLLNGEEAGKDD
ncbi:ATP-binding region, ATPase-like protein [Roseobacter sp. AzwK-3b]|uniref:response regulator n=1 Tax=Roseobacter sp. AzwK-3b TaxID=351016 RepID=UPI0001568BBF|nr:response regulator [Roseobacter sp. AzwK-3b]EDM72844.1 ATP-binding region, ATPase-like protein [Roseobacter sp. AzwK-3b]